jgi:plastocyanin
MSRYIKGPGLIGTLLLVFIVAIGFAMWTLDLVAQQRTFAFLFSAELLAFSMLVYLYYAATPQEIRKRWLLIGSVALAALVILAVAVFPGVSTTPKTQTPNVSIVLYEGKISASSYGFGYSPTSLVSPGPTLTFKVGDVVNVTVTNVGQLPHNWALVSSNQTSAPVQFGAQIQSASNPLQHGQTGSVVFTVTKAGAFYYICQVPGHVELGMYGQVVVNS